MKNDKIIKIPITSKQRNINEMGNGYVPCEVSLRWLQFDNESSIVDGRELFNVNVMTYDCNEKPRKLCSLIISKEDIIRAINNIKISNNKRNE